MDKQLKRQGKTIADMPTDQRDMGPDYNPLAAAVQQKEIAGGANMMPEQTPEAAQERMASRQLGSVVPSQITDTGWYDVPMQELGYAGKLYPADLRMIYRAATVAEIRHWSTLDDAAQPMDAAQHITDMIAVCVRCISKSGSRTYSHKDIYEHDKWKLLILIHQLTFPENAELTNPIVFNITSGTCKHQFKLNLSPDNIHWDIPTNNGEHPGIEAFDKYIDAEFGGWLINTKSFGSFRIKPPTMGNGKAFADYMLTLDPEKMRSSHRLIMNAQWFAPDWRELTSNAKVEACCQAFNSMDPLNEMPLKLDILDSVRILPAETIKFTCPQCNTEGTAPFRFPKGIKQVFRRISNIESELL